MELKLFFVLVLCNIRTAYFQRDSCTLDFACEECLPEYMPIVTSHRFNGSRIDIPQGDEVTFSCENGKFFLYPQRSVVRGYCEEDRYRMHEDAALRHALELGCQANVFEDVKHHVEECGAPYQGRSYLIHTAKGTVKHVAELCFDLDRAVPLFIKMGNHPNNEMPVPKHSDTNSPLNVMGSFAYMFDSKTRAEAEKLFMDSEKMNKRMFERLKHDRFEFAGQSLASENLLSSQYLKDENTRAASFVSNRIPMWRSVAKGNYKHLTDDIAAMLKAAPSNEEVNVYAGTHDVFQAKYSGLKHDVYLKTGERFPVPKYVWNVIVDAKTNKGVALITLNDPFVAVSEIRNSVFCESVCTHINWLHELKRNQHFETPIYGLVFCCDVHSFGQTVREMPRSVLSAVKQGEGGVLTDIPGF